MKKLIISLITFLLISINVQSIAEPITEYKIKTYKTSKVYIIKTQQYNLNSSTTLKGYRHGTNCSFFNVKTRKVVPVGIYNRPFIIFKNDNTVKISDNIKEITETDKVLSGGSWLVRDSKIYSSNDHFSKSFKNMQVNRTVFGIDKNGNVYLVILINSSLYRASNFMRDLGCTEAIAVDGGSSTQMKHNGKLIITGKKVVNYLVIR